MTTKMETHGSGGASLFWLHISWTQGLNVLLPDVSAVLPGVSRELCRAQRCVIFDILPKILFVASLLCYANMQPQGQRAKKLSPLQTSHTWVQAVREQQIILWFIIDPAWRGNHASGLCGITLSGDSSCLGCSCGWFRER